MAITLYHLLSFKPKKMIYWVDLNGKHKTLSLKEIIEGTDNQLFGKTSTTRVSVPQLSNLPGLK